MSYVAILVSTMLFAPTASAEFPSITVARAPLSIGALTSQQQATVNSVSCWGLNDCVGVGSFRTSAGNQLLIGTEVAGTWSSGPRVSLPSDRAWSWTKLPGPITELTSVSCPTASTCVAVGSYLTSSGFEPLVAIETQGHWSNALRISLPGTAALTSQQSALLAVNCASAISCVAVGTFLDSNSNQLPFSVTSNNDVWSAAQIPLLPSGAVNSDQVSELTSVSCPNVGNCNAVGSFINQSGYAAMVLSLRANHWASASIAVTIVEPSNAISPANAQATTLNAISCLTVSSCVSVGQFATTSGYSPMGVTSSNFIWTQAQQIAAPTMSKPSGALFGGLNALSCVPGNCLAVGTYGDAVSNFGFRSEWTGTLWTSSSVAQVPSDVVSNGASELNATQCFTATACVQVGSYLTSSGTEGQTATPPTAPDRPTHVVVIAKNSSVLVTWSAPAYNGLSPITSYLVTASPGSATCSSVSFHCTITGLTNGSHYSFVVSATNLLGVSALSSPGVSATPVTVPGPPKVTGVTGYLRSIFVKWTAPNTNGGSVISSYEFSTNGGSTWQSRNKTPASTSLTISGLLRHHAYRIAIRARNVVGFGASSNVVHVTTH